MEPVKPAMITDMVESKFKAATGKRVNKLLVKLRKKLLNGNFELRKYIDKNNFELKVSFHFVSLSDLEANELNRILRQEWGWSRAFYICGHVYLEVKSGY